METKHPKAKHDDDDADAADHAAMPLTPEARSLTPFGEVACIKSAEGFWL